MTNDLHHLAAAYALDALDESERARFEAHYPTCDVCRQEVEDFAATAGFLAGGAAVPPPATLKQRVMHDVGETRQLPPVTRWEPAGQAGTVVDLDVRRRRRWTSALGAAAAVALVVASSVLIVGNRGGGELDDVLAAPDAIVTPLDGATGSVRVVWSAERGQVAVFGNGLDAPDDGYVYELWALAPDGPVPAGLFSPDDGVVRAVLDVDDVEAGGWGVTIEPDGGSPQPTGNILYVVQY